MNLIRNEVIVSLPVKLAYLFSIALLMLRLERLSHLKTLCGGVAIAHM